MYLTLQPQIHEAKTDRIERRNEQIHNYCLRHQYSSLKEKVDQKNK